MQNLTSRFLCILTSKSSRHNGVQFLCLIWPDSSPPAALASLLFDLAGSQNIGKTQRFATFLPFRAPSSSFFWLFFGSDLLSSFFFFFSDSFICPYCRKFDFQTSFNKACTAYSPVLLRNFVLGRLHKLLPNTTWYYEAFANYFPLLLCTTKSAQTTSQYQ